MVFTTDRQTTNDLNIFGKHGVDSVYQLFNRTHTQGGAALLEDMFLYPLSDPEEINKRSAIIRRYAENNMPFPLDNIVFDAVEPYLANTDERTRLSREESGAGMKLSHLFGMDPDKAAIIKGIEAVARLLNMVKELLARKGFDEETQEVLEALLSEPELAAVNGIDRPSNIHLADWDASFRFRHRQTIRKILHRVYLLDVYLAVAQVARERNYVFARAVEQGEGMVSLTEVYHPMVKGAIPNSLRVTREGNVIFLTGANMAGKSTFMKTIGIAMFLAHMGFPVPARDMEFEAQDGIYTSINLFDNLGLGASHFYAEVLRVKKIAQELAQSRRLLVIFDELFRGTNVKDAYEATVAIVAAFAGKRNSVFIISTHIIEAGETLQQNCRNILFRFLPTRMSAQVPVYTYRLEEGITEDRHGMIIIRNEGILDILERGNHLKKVLS